MLRCLSRSSLVWLIARGARPAISMAGLCQLSFTVQKLAFKGRWYVHVLAALMPMRYRTCGVPDPDYVGQGVDNGGFNDLLHADQYEQGGLAQYPWSLQNDIDDCGVMEPISSRFCICRLLNTRGIAYSAGISDWPSFFCQPRGWR